MIFMLQNRFSHVLIFQNKLGDNVIQPQNRETLKNAGGGAFCSNAHLYCLLTETFTTLVNSTVLKGLSCEKPH